MIFQADDKMVKVMGRTLYRDNIRYLGYSCSSIEFEFTGSRAVATLWTDSPSLDKIYKAWVAVFVNDEEEPSRRFSLEQEEADYVLYEAEKTAKTKIKLVKYSEVAFGKVGIKSIKTDSDLSPAPTASKARKLEFIGDSITCGYGDEGIWNVDVFNTTQENPWDAYAAKTSRALDADYQLISWSGIGIISNYSDNDVPNHTDWLMPELYPYTDRATECAVFSIGHDDSRSHQVWENNKFVPDCIVINLGTNDSSYTKNIKERVDNFGKEYYKFLQKVRACNPKSVLLCTLGVMGQDLCSEIEKQICKAVKEGDSQVYFMAYDIQQETDGIGADWHPSKITHEKMAKKLENRIREIMNW